jgi:vacuolar-type H+-ATPase subunit D/Vma8|tara:strand:+ start:772 stop:903 length:132 start_codon:yes stop_codon:yes gene_type:complete
MDLKETIDMITNMLNEGRKEALSLNKKTKKKKKKKTNHEDSRD